MAFEKVPVLGDIPLLGALFHYKTRSRTKTNLMVFLRPTLVRDSQRADAFTGERYDYILGEQAKGPSRRTSAVLPDMDSPTLPPRPVPAPALLGPPASVPTLQDEVERRKFDEPGLPPASAPTSWTNRARASIGPDAPGRN